MVLEEFEEMLYSILYVKISFFSESETNLRMENQSDSLHLLHLISLH